MKIVNLTPHDIHVLRSSGPITILSNGTSARVQAERIEIDQVNGIPIFNTTYKSIQALPEPLPDTVYIVSAIVAQAAKDRDDLLVPDDLVRDEVGRIVGCRSFSKI